MICYHTISVLSCQSFSKKQGDHPKRNDRPVSCAASILDIFSCVVQGIIPHGGQILLCVSLTGLSPFSIIGANYYCFLLTI